MEITGIEERVELLSKTMPGFSGLIDVLQAMIAADSLITAEVWVTQDVERTLTFAREKLAEINSMCEAWGVEK